MREKVILRCLAVLMISVIGVNDAKSEVLPSPVVKGVWNVTEDFKTFAGVKLYVARFGIAENSPQVTEQIYWQNSKDDKFYCLSMNPVSIGSFIRDIKGVKSDHESLVDFATIVSRVALGYYVKLEDNSDEKGEQKNFNIQKSPAFLDGKILFSARDGNGFFWNFEVFIKGDSEVYDIRCSRASTNF